MLLFLLKSYHEQMFLSTKPQAIRLRFCNMTICYQALIASPEHNRFVASTICPVQYTATDQFLYNKL